ncbi:50 kDa hatching enzyme [Holothuria leucospilota]|uniref:50 kDa hatching enzyme n=1 Tax=Holothuria leucospilota TaxID=206669 RepID=A0A9Q0YH10_HOLLE|nr:50 kDa hatching enzyme [Holothuria leucospilota]
MCLLFCCYVLIIIIAAKGRTNGSLFDMSEQERMMEAEEYLKKYGYLPDIPETTSSPELLQTSPNFHEAVRLFQAYVGLEQTGELDNETLTFMESPRCGFKDFSSPGEDGEVLKYSTGTVSWPKNHLKYFIKEYSIKLRDEEVKEIFQDSFQQLWADVTPLSFAEVENEFDADIVIRFATRQHGDANPFDGLGRVLAHAWLPTSGRAHFDDDENWAGPTGYGKSLQQVAVHEIGHMLGMKHSSAPEAVMAPYFRSGRQYHISVLDEDDIVGIQSLYGAPTVSTTMTQFTTVSPVPNGACLDKVDAVTCSNVLQRCYVFNGPYCWSIEGVHRQVSIIDSVFLFSPSNVNAAFFSPSNGRTYILKGCYVYQYDENLNFVSRRRNSQVWQALPCSINAIFYSSNDGLTYAFKNSWVYAYNSGRLYGRIRIENLRWPNMPSELFTGIDAVSDVPPGGQFSDNFVYVFKGDHYYMMNRRTKFFSTDSYNVKGEIYTGCA